jgi:hypothetical protein
MHPIRLDAAGHRRQPVTLPCYHAGRPPRNKGRHYPANPPTVERGHHSDAHRGRLPPTRPLPGPSDAGGCSIDAVFEGGLAESGMIGAWLSRWSKGR